jgi:hypothetical protein
MKNITVRKRRSVTVHEASNPVVFSNKEIESLRKLQSEPFEGESEQDFVKYLLNLYPDNHYDSLDLPLYEKLMSLNEFNEYGNSLEKGSNECIEYGEIDPAYRRFGGFNAKYSTED